jgi:hypothetical protein
MYESKETHIGPENQWATGINLHTKMLQAFEEAHEFKDAWQTTS